MFHKPCCFIFFNLLVIFWRNVKAVRNYVADRIAIEDEKGGFSRILESRTAYSYLTRDTHVHALQSIPRPQTHTTCIGRVLHITATLHGRVVPFCHIVHTQVGSRTISPRTAPARLVIQMTRYPGAKTEPVITQNQPRTTADQLQATGYHEQTP